MDANTWILGMLIHVVRLLNLHVPCRPPFSASYLSLQACHFLTIIYIFCSIDVHILLTLLLRSTNAHRQCVWTWHADKHRRWQCTRHRITSIPKGDEEARDGGGQLNCSSINCSITLKIQCRTTVCVGFFQCTSINMLQAVYLPHSKWACELQFCVTLSNCSMYPLQLGIK